MPIVRILTWNVLYGGVGREEPIGAAVRQLHPDIAIFTEARATPSFAAIAALVGPYWARSGTARDRECVAVASRWPIVRSERIGPRWAPSKWVVATIQPPVGAELTVVGLHLAPYMAWPAELLRTCEAGALLTHLPRDGPHVVAGDFNALSVGDGHQLNRAPSWIRLQLLTQLGMTPRWALSRFLAAGYVDCYRARNPGSHGFTVPAWDPQVRIDYLFASPGLEPVLRAAGAGECAIDQAERAPRRSVSELLGRTPVRSLNGAASDHLPVWADFEWG